MSKVISKELKELIALNKVSDEYVNVNITDTLLYYLFEELDLTKMAAEKLQKDYATEECKEMIERLERTMQLYYALKNVIGNVDQYFGELFDKINEIKSFEF